MDDEATVTELTASTPTCSSLVDSPSTSFQPGPSNVEKEDQRLKLLGPYPYDAPPGYHWVPNGWKLEPVQEAQIPDVSFEQLFLNKIKSVGGKKRQRSKLDMRAKVSSFLAKA